MNTESIDLGLARYSDWAFTASVVILVLALLLLAVELASSRIRRVAEPEPVAAGHGPADPESPRRPRDPRRTGVGGANGGR